MKKIIAIVVVIALLAGAIFGVINYQKQKVVGRWQSTINCEEILAKCYADEFAEKTGWIGISTIDIPSIVDNAVKDSNPVYITVILELNKDGQYSISLSREDIIPAIEGAVDRYNHRMATSIVSYLLGTTDVRVSSAVKMGSELINEFFNVDVESISDKLIVSVLEAAVTDSINRNRVSDLICASFEERGRYEAGTGKIVLSGSRNKDGQDVKLSYRISDETLSFAHNTEPVHETLLTSCEWKAA